MDADEEHQWYCVHIPQSQILRASNNTFVEMLKAEYLAKQSPPDCPVYVAPAADGDGMRYYFAPRASPRFSSFLKYWGAEPISAPENLYELPRLV